jgi:membrane protease YdiL (CAAX protease family)
LTHSQADGAACADLVRKENMMTTMKAFIKKHPVLSYFALVFVISWTGFVAVVGPDGFPLSWERFERLGLLLYVVALAGPSVAGILMIVLTEGRAGLREFLSRLLRWRVGASWYAVALLPGVLMAATTLGLSLLAPEFTPAIFTAEDKAGILLPVIAVSLLFGVFEEVGWTGFAVPKLRARHGVVTTGLIVGLVWGAWHFPLFWETDTFSAALPLALLLARLFSWLLAFRVLMVWVYDHTGSLLVAMLMHVSLVANQLILGPQEITGAARLTSVLALAATLWLLVAAVTVANHGQLARQGKPPASIGAPQLTPR